MNSKYHNKRTFYEGRWFASQREKERYQELQILVRAGHIQNLELQPRFTLVVNGEHICDYVGDFRYRQVETGIIIVEDVKGFRTREYILKRKLMKALHGIEITEV